MFMYGGWLHVGGEHALPEDLWRERGRPVRALLLPGILFGRGVLAQFPSWHLPWNRVYPPGSIRCCCRSARGIRVIVPETENYHPAGSLVVPLQALAVIGFWMTLQFFNGIDSVIDSADT